MQQVFLSRRNLLTLLAKLDRAAKGETTLRSIVKNDTVHPVYPCTDVIRVTAVEDKDYYTERPAGDMHPHDEAAILAFACGDCGAHACICEVVQ